MSHRTVLGLKLATFSVCFLALTIVTAIGLRALTGYSGVVQDSAENTAEIALQTGPQNPSENGREPASQSAFVFVPKGSLNASELGLLGSTPQIRGQKVAVNLGRLMDPNNQSPRTVVFNLFPDLSLNIDLQKPSVYGVNSGLLVGLVQGDPESFVRILIQNGVVDGTIRSQKREFRIVDGGYGLHIVTEAKSKSR